MFTGIVEEMGEVVSLTQINDGWTLVVSADKVLEGSILGDSIAINGTCLTITEFEGNTMSFGLAPETLRKTSLGELTPGRRVNLERSVTPTTRMGGHFVQGHVDGMGKIIRFTPEDDSLWVEVETAPEILKYIVPKGFIAVDGTSLTVVDVNETSFTFMLVAYTQEHIVIPSKKVGEHVNLEVDILGKYVERILAHKLQG